MRIIQLVCLIFCILLFSACPVGNEYAPANPGSEPIDKALIGTWVTDSGDAEFKKAVVTKGENNSYFIEVSETTDNFMAGATQYNAWVTSIEGLTFIYARPTDGKDYYLYCYKLDGKKKLSIFDVGLLVNGKDGVTSVEAYREEIRQSLKKKECLSGEIRFTKR
jgi:hypothetical protein